MRPPRGREEHVRATTAHIGHGGAAASRCGGVAACRCDDVVLLVVDMMAWSMG